MTSCKTLGSPIRSLALERRAQAALVLLAVSAVAHAHDVDPAAIPESGLRASAAMAASLADAKDALPAPTLPGVLGTGQQSRDRRGLRLEHAVAEVAGRASFGLGGQLALGLHDRDKPHVEAAWLDFALGRDVYLGGGRNTVPTTPALSRAGHFDRFGLMPLAKQALFEGNWTEDGVTLAWRPHDTEAAWWPARATLAAWRGRAFPAGGQTPDSNADRPFTASVGWDAGDTFKIDVFGARMRPRSRGSLIQDTGFGHSHGSPTCDTTLAGRVCFDGSVSLWGASAAWTPLKDWTVSTTVVLRDEKGSLYSSTGDARYRGRTTGAWGDVVWQAMPQWELAARVERLVVTHELDGPGASLVAQDASLMNNSARRRLSAALAWSRPNDWRVSLEAGNDRSTGARNPYVMMRVVWQHNTDLKP